MIASSFNLIDELQTFIESMEKEAKQLKSFDTRENANANIADMKSFVDSLMENQESLSKQGTAVPARCVRGCLSHHV